MLNELGLRLAKWRQAWQSCAQALVPLTALISLIAGVSRPDVATASDLDSSEIFGSTLIGLTFNEVNEVRTFKQGEVTMVAVRGKAWTWNHHVTFPASDSGGRQCMQNFYDYWSKPGSRMLQFGGYSSSQYVDTQGRTTQTNFSVITECYFR